MSTAAPPQPKAAVRWKHRHLLGLEDLSAEEILLVLDTAREFHELAAVGERKLTALAGRVVANLFFEPSTRTRTSFSVAAKRLGADVVDFTSGGSSLSKGETFIDTARNIAAMGVDLIVVRHQTPGAPHLLAQNLNLGIINAGDGAHEHPTQGLLDIFTIREKKGGQGSGGRGRGSVPETRTLKPEALLQGLTVGLIGDIAHSRVARSNIWGLTKLGAHVIVCGPATLIPRPIARLGVEIAYDFDAILPRLDVVNLLRIQFERQRSGLFPSIREYAHLFGMNGERVRRAKDDVLILAPGPINRGVEITPEVADGPHSVILEQVTNGLAVRMAVLSLLDEAQGRK